jgi:hypothetical protein
VKRSGRHILAAALGVGMLAVLLGLIVLDGLISAEPRETVALRPVAFRDPPPPPPPPVTREDPVEDPSPELSEAARQVPLELTTMNLEIKVPAGQLTGEGGGWGDGIGVDLGTVDLGDLDGIPQVVRSPVLDDYPEELLDQGIGGFEAVVHILIDEQGRPYLIEVLGSAYPPYNPKLEDFVAEVRFTPPTMLGIPVRTEYAWPLLIKLP